MRFERLNVGFNIRSSCLVFRFGFGSVIIRFDQLTLDIDRLELRNDGELIDVEPQVFSLLAYLIKNRDRVVSKDELIEAVWNGRIVSDTTLHTRINAVRRAVGDDGKAQSVVRTFPRRGFRFVADVTEGAQPRRDFQRLPTLPTSHGVKERAGGLNSPPEPSSIHDRPTIAVLLFDRIGDDDEGLSAGLAEAVTISLSKRTGGTVIAHDLSGFARGRPRENSAMPAPAAASYVIISSQTKGEIMANAKYEIIDHTVKHRGHYLRRIRALRDISNYVWAGDLGGWIESERNLSAIEDCWICDNAKVFGDARVCNSSIVSDDAQVFSEARIYDEANVSGAAQVYGAAIVSGKAWISDEARIYSKSRVYENAWVSSKASIYGKSHIYGEAHVFGEAAVFDNAEINEDARVYGRAQIYGDAAVGGGTWVFGEAHIGGNVIILGDPFIVAGKTKLL